MPGIEVMSPVAAFGLAGTGFLAANVALAAGFLTRACFVAVLCLGAAFVGIGIVMPGMFIIPWLL